MTVKITYPKQTKQKLKTYEIRNYLKLPFLCAAYICPVVNLYVGGQMWSIVVLWSLWMAWTLVFSPNLVEYNRISQLVKLIVESSILLTLIDLLLSPGWAASVVPIVCFGGLILTGILFFTDLDRQKQNMMPMLWMIAALITSFIISVSFWAEQSGWAFAVMGIIAFTLLFVCIFVLGKDLLRELKKRFHVR